MINPKRKIHNYNTLAYIEMKQKNLSICARRDNAPSNINRISIGDKSTSCWFTNKGVLVGISSLEFNFR